MTLVASTEKNTTQARIVRFQDTLPHSTQGPVICYISKEAQRKERISRRCVYAGA